jgi:exodeoxyribonuclease VII large subunit
MTPSGPFGDERSAAPDSGAVRHAAGPHSAGRDAAGLEAPSGPISVSALTARIKSLLEHDPQLREVHLVGEISNFKHHQARHMYFSLKDSGAQIRCVFFHPANRNLDFRPADGTEVVARGYVTVYPPTGQYQLYIQSLRRSGAGELYRRFEELKKKLIEEGLTAPERKRALPDFPRRIGIVASAESAALQDILNVLSRRYPLATVVLAAVAVEGEASAPSIAAGLEAMARRGRADVVIVGRGGGSIESLWAFNTERVTRAIAAMPVPVISAVGHETDTTIADFVSDRRAATPTEAAELATPSIEEIRAGLSAVGARLERFAARGLRDAANRLAGASRALRSPRRLLDERTERIDRLRESAESAVLARRDRLDRRLRDLLRRVSLRSPERKLLESSARLERLSNAAFHALLARVESGARRAGILGARLEGLNPTAILGRGYAIALHNGRAVRDAGTVVAGEHVAVRLHRGELGCEVREIITNGEDGR